MSTSAGAGAPALCHAALVEPWEPLAADWTGWRGRRRAGRGLRLAAWHEGPLAESRGVRENDGAGGLYPKPTLTHHLQDRKASISNTDRAERAAACGQLMGLGCRHLPRHPTSRQPLLPNSHCGGCRGLALRAAASPPRVPEVPVLSCRQSSRSGAPEGGRCWLAPGRLCRTGACRREAGLQGAAGPECPGPGLQASPSAEAPGGHLDALSVSDFIF